jgi:glycosyltransferase involved in cell wall biosynthesis
LLIISQQLPQFGNYSTTSVLRSLLRSLSPEIHHVIGFYHRGDKKKSMDFRYTYSAVPFLSERAERYYRFAMIPIVVLCGIFALIKRKHKGILVVFPDDASLLAAYILHLITRKPLYPYLMDLYQETGVWAKPLDQWLQPRIFRKAARILVINEGMLEYYKDHYGLETVCLPMALPQMPNQPRLFKDKTPGQLTIAYSGTVNGARLEGLKRLTAVVKKLPGVRIAYFTPQPVAFLKAQGLWMDTFSHQNISEISELIKALSACDVVFNPVYAGKVDIAQIKTSFGGKIVEYLASGVPMLIDADESFFTYRIFKKHGVGVLVEHGSEASLEQALRQLNESEEFYNKASQSNERFYDYFHPERIKKIFLKTI